MSTKNTPKTPKTKLSFSASKATTKKCTPTPNKFTPKSASKIIVCGRSGSTTTINNDDFSNRNSANISHLRRTQSIESRLSKSTPSITIGPTKTTTQRNVQQNSTPNSFYKRLMTQSLEPPITPDCFSTVCIESSSSSSAAISTTPSLFSSSSMRNHQQNLASGGGNSSNSSTTDNENVKTKDSNKDIGGEISNLSVAVRVRPMNQKELSMKTISNIITVNGNELTVSAGTSADNSAGVSHSFQYDQIFWCCNTEHENYADQAAVFQGTTMSLMDKAFGGYNACLFAYGQTGSGKSYSMMGVDADEEIIAHDSEAGIIPRFCQELFRRIDALKEKQHIEVEISYFEIYNEKIHDLLAVASQLQFPANTPTNSNGNYVINVSTSTNQQQTKRLALRVREHPVWGPYVVDLSTHPVDSHMALRNWMAVGNSQRATAATGMNDKSSRSHSIFNVILNISDKTIEKNGKSSSAAGGGPPQTKRSKISLVDLAGSERISHTRATGDRLREGVSVNKSLLTLGKVIAALADSKKSSVFVPYRESVLTWLLRENLGGNSRTVMLATISPASIYTDETLATLRYACQARTIVNRVKVNEDPHDRQIRELRAEVERLQVLQQDYERQKRLSSGDTTPITRHIIIETSATNNNATAATAAASSSAATLSVVDDTEVISLRQQLNDTEQQLALAQRSWRDRLREAEAVRKSEMNLLQRNGLALQLSTAQKQPCLVNLAVDPMLSGTLLYVLPLGIVKIGRARSSANVVAATTTKVDKPDIVLDGPLVAFNHCIIENLRGELFIEPKTNEFDTYVNGETLISRKQIYNGDRVVIGGSHYFRVSNPHCNRRLNETIDFHSAHQEILQEQEKQLRNHLNAEKAAALQKIEQERAENERRYKEKMAKLELEKFRYKCSKDLYEAEMRTIEECKDKQPIIEYQPYQSNLLDEIKRIMQHPSAECLHETQIKVKEATQRCRDLGIVQFEFKQSQVADEFGIFRAVINIIDHDRQLIAEWPPARLDVWLEMIRDNEINNENLFDCVDIVFEPLNDEHIKMEANEYGGGVGGGVGGGDNGSELNQSLNSSRISLDLSAVKNMICGGSGGGKNNFKSIRNVFSPMSLKPSPQKMIKSALLNSNNNKNMHLNDPVEKLTTRKRLIYEDSGGVIEKQPPATSVLSVISPPTSANTIRFENQAQLYLKELRKSTLKFKTLCYNQTNRENEMTMSNKMTSTDINQIMETLEQIEQLTNDMRSIVTNSLKEASPTSTKPIKSVRFLLD